MNSLNQLICQCSLFILGLPVFRDPDHEHTMNRDAPGSQYAGVRSEFGNTDPDHTPMIARAIS